MEGLEVLKSRSYDAIISDYQMPDMGWDPVFKGS